MTTDAGKRTTPRRDAELIALVPDHLGTDGLCIAVTLSIKGGMLLRPKFRHDETPKGLADAMRKAADWVENK